MAQARRIGVRPTLDGPVADLAGGRLDRRAGCVEQGQRRIERGRGLVDKPLPVAERGGDQRFVAAAPGSLTVNVLSVRLLNSTGLSIKYCMFAAVNVSESSVG